MKNFSAASVNFCEFNFYQLNGTIFFTRQICNRSLKKVFVHYVRKIFNQIVFVNRILIGKNKRVKLFIEVKSIIFKIHLRGKKINNC